MPSRFFITGTDTGVGKTVVSALLCAALDATYWKPIQTGAREGTDRNTIIRLAQLPRDRTIPEVYQFAPPVSPHLAARRAAVRIDLRKLGVPRGHAIDNLIVEGAGGVFVPINESQLMVDLMARLRLPVFLVCRSSLGTINHTLLSVTALRAANLDVRGVIMTGKLNIENQKAVEYYGDVRTVGTVPFLKKLNRRTLLEVFRTHFNRRAFQT